MTTAQLLSQNAIIRQAAAREAQALADAYGLTLRPTVTPVETAPVSWQRARNEEEQKRGVKLWKYFHD